MKRALILALFLGGCVGAGRPAVRARPRPASQADRDPPNVIETHQSGGPMNPYAAAGGDDKASSDDSSDSVEVDTNVTDDDSDATDTDGSDGGSDVQIDVDNGD